MAQTASGRMPCLLGRVRPGTPRLSPGCRPGSLPPGPLYLGISSARWDPSPVPLTLQTAAHGSHGSRNRGALMLRRRLARTPPPPPPAASAASAAVSRAGPGELPDFAKFGSGRAPGLPPAGEAQGGLRSAAAQGRLLRAERPGVCSRGLGARSWASPLHIAGMCLARRPLPPGCQASASPWLRTAPSAETNPTPAPWSCRLQAPQACAKALQWGWELPWLPPSSSPLPRSTGEKPGKGSPPSPCCFQMGHSVPERVLPCLLLCRFACGLHYQ